MVVVGGRVFPRGCISLRGGGVSPRGSVFPCGGVSPRGGVCPCGGVSPRGGVSLHGEFNLHFLQFENMRVM